MDQMYPPFLHWPIITLARVWLSPQGVRLPVGTIIGATRSNKELRVGDKVFDLASETTAPDALAGAKAGIIVGTQGGKIGRQDEYWESCMARPSTGRPCATQIFIACTSRSSPLM